MGEPAPGLPAGVIVALHPRLLALERYWSQKRKLGWAPAKGDIDRLEMASWLGNLMILSVVDGGRDFFYRLYGTNLVQLFGRELTGRKVSSLGLVERHRILGRFRAVIDARKPRHFRFEHHLDEAVLAVCELTLPLTDDGERVSHLLVGAYESP